MSARLPRLLHELVTFASPTNVALVASNKETRYADLVGEARRVASALGGLGISQGDRVAIYLPKRLETVVAMLAASIRGAAFVPVNPLLKAQQVAHILDDSDAKLLVTSASRLEQIDAVITQCASLRTVILIDGVSRSRSSLESIAWSELRPTEHSPSRRRTLENDVVAILYTSGSTGRPKGVTLSHRNLVVGALSVAEYLENNEQDRILSLLPLSFDAGLSQLTTAFSVSARAVLLDYLVPADVPRECERHAITGITGVPPLWMQLVSQRWTENATRGLRYFANTGGKMPRDTLEKLRALFPHAKPYLMYGLTEAFRSTYLPPSEVDARPDSIGKAIPNVEVLVVRPDGSECAPHEPGELVHRGPLVALGYWKDPERTRERYRPAPGQPEGLPHPELAVWSGDTVTRDEDGFLYFVGRNDDMIKTSGYRVSPTEIEEAAFASGLVAEAAALGVEDAALGQAIILVVKPTQADVAVELLLDHLRATLPGFMVPRRVILSSGIPRNPNGKIDRRALASELMEGTR